MEALRRWDWMFDKEVHGGLLTFISEAKHWFSRRNASVSLTPRHDR